MWSSPARTTRARWPTWTTSNNHCTLTCLVPYACRCFIGSCTTMWTRRTASCTSVSTTRTRRSTTACTYVLTYAQTVTTVAVTRAAITKIIRQRPDPAVVTGTIPNRTPTTGSSTAVPKSRSKRFTANWIQSCTDSWCEHKNTQSLNYSSTCYIVTYLRLHYSLTMTNDVILDS